MSQLVVLGSGSWDSVEGALEQRYLFLGCLERVVEILGMFEVYGLWDLEYKVYIYWLFLLFSIATVMINTQ